MINPALVVQVSGMKTSLGEFSAPWEARWARLLLIKGTFAAEESMARAIQSPHGTMCAIGLLVAAFAVRAEHDVQSGLDYTLEYRRALNGGLGEGGAWLDQLVLYTGVESRWYVSALVTNANTFSDRFSGDAQVVSNLDTGDTQRIYEAWYQWQLGESRLLAGLLDLNSEFDAIETAGLFNNASHGIGPDFSQSGERGPSIFPHAAFGLRLSGGGDRLAWRIAAFDAVPGSPTDERRTSVQFHHDEGALLVGEIERPGPIRMVLGGWAYTKAFDSLDGATRDRERGLYAIADGTLWGNGERSLGAYLRIGHADSDALPVVRYFGGGLVYSASATQQFGLAVANVRFSALSQRLLRGEGAHPASSETAIELTWRWRLNDWFALQPDLQWVDAPGGRLDLPDATVAALRMDFSW